MLFREPELFVRPTIDEVLDALEDARVVLNRQRGLAKRNAVDWVNGIPCFCIVAAITFVSPTTRVRDAALDCVRSALPGRFRGSSIETYNDAPGTTVEHAKTLLVNAKSFAGSVAA